MSTQTPTSRPDEELIFHSLESPDPSPRWRRWLIGGVASFLFHGFLITGLEFAPADWSSQAVVPLTLAKISERPAVHLVAPKFALTQPEPNKTKPTTEVSLPQLLSRPEPVRPNTPPPAPRKFVPPTAVASKGPSSVPPQNIPAIPGPPKIEGGTITSAGINPQGLPTAPPSPSDEKPKLAFENLSSVRTANPDPNRNLPRITVPRSGIEEAMRNAGREQQTGGLTIGDSGEVAGNENPLRTPQGRNIGRQASNIELLSDPQGIDFKPYLIRVLAAIRRNWFAVLPESAKMGLRSGKVQVQFAINRDGKVPKLVLATPSGTDAFDRAAVAGISASNPFPPLPPEFKGDQIRLQLSFLYNAH